MIETSVLVSASISGSFRYKGIKYKICEELHYKCSNLFNKIKELKIEDKTIITKTVEDEAKGVLNKAVERTIKNWRILNIQDKFNLMVLQNIVTNTSLDNLDDIVEFNSTRIAINNETRTKIRDEEITPFLSSILKGTVRYLKPSTPRFIKGSFKNELEEIMVKSLPETAHIYLKGMPADKDLTIMAEATMISRKFKEQIYLASIDNHFKPNPIQVGSYLSPRIRFTGDLDSYVRDQLASKFGFIGEEPDTIITKIRSESVTDLPKDLKNHSTGVVGPGQPFSGAKELRQVFSSLKDYVKIIDPYVSRETLDTFLDIPLGIQISLLTVTPRSGSFDAQFIRSCAQFKTERNTFQIRAATQLHDRYILDKERGWIVGHSLKDFGNKLSTIVPLTSEQKSEIEQRFDDHWKNASIIL